MHTSVRKLLDIETDLRHALEQNAFFLQFQPIVSLETGQIQSFEALLRWRHPQKGIIPPSDFIPIAEDSGLIIGIGQWVLEESCRRAAQWRKLSRGTEVPFHIHVNVSSKQVTQPNFLPHLEELLNEYDLPGNALNLEITESLIMEDTAASGEFISRVSELGMTISIDDFGTGYSSLSYLQKFRVHMIKADRSFIQKLPGQEEDTELVRAIIVMADHLKLQVVAEGIETQEQAQLLESMGCRLGQGYYFSRPVDAEQAEELFSKGLPLPRTESE